jgi:2-C-methyl-D-erythritol 4-phosphate cytidylyltransferase
MVAVFIDDVCAFSRRERIGVWDEGTGFKYPKAHPEQALLSFQAGQQQNPDFVLLHPGARCFSCVTVILVRNAG